MTIDLVDPGPDLAPTSPERFRVEVNGKRRYRDVLPADGTWEATDELFINITSITGGDADWSNAAIKRIAEALVDDPHLFDGLDLAGIKAAMREINERGGAAASARGTQLHELIDARLLGKPDPELGAAARQYVPAVEKMIATLNPRPIASEFVAFSRYAQYAGTGDFVGHLDVDGYDPATVWAVDWKSRLQHKCENSEFAQVAAAIHADYWIVEEEGEAVRRPPVEVDRIAIVSISPQGYKVYPCEDGAGAHQLFVSLRTSERLRGADLKAKPLPGVKLSAPGPAVADVAASPAQAQEDVRHPPAAPEPTYGVATVEITADVERFKEAAQAAADSMRQVLKATRPWDELAQRRLRAQEIKASNLGAELLKLWPKRQDGLMPSLNTPGDITHEEWIIIDLALTDVEKVHGLYVDDTERDVLRAKHAELPSDLKAEFGAWYASTGWSGAHRMTRGQADATIEVLHPLYVRAAERKAQVTQHLAMVDEATAEAVVRLVVRPERVDAVLADLGQVLELEAEAIGCVVDAIAEGVIWFRNGAWDEVRLDTKGLRDAARPIAERYELPLPRSAADVTASPLLAALTWGAM